MASGRMKDWTAGRRARFLNALKTHCDPDRACAEVNMKPTALYRLLDSDAGFVAAVRAAIDWLYRELELKLLAIAGAGTGSAKVERELAMKLLALRDARRKIAAGFAGKGGAVLRATPEQTDAAILKHLAALKARHRTAARR